jgi:GntR family transcriptional regulator
MAQMNVIGRWLISCASAFEDSSVTKSAKENGIPAYRRIQQAIQRRIDSGQLRPGDAVESERDLARVHGVSLMTARHALAQLQRESVVERRPGAGTFVAQPRIHFNRLVSFSEQMAARGFSAHSRILATRIIEGEYEVTARLGVPASTRLLRLERVRLGDKQPFALEICYLDVNRFPELTEISLERHSLFNLLEQKYGVKLAYADEEVDATAADHRIQELLAVSRDAPLLRIRQVLYDSTGGPIAYSVALYRSDRHSLLTRRYR